MLQVSAYFRILLYFNKFSKTEETIKNRHLRITPRWALNGTNILRTLILLFAATMLPYTAAAPTAQEIINNALQVMNILRIIPQWSTLTQRTLWWHQRASLNVSRRAQPFTSLSKAC